MFGLFKRADINEGVQRYAATPNGVLLDYGSLEEARYLAENIYCLQLASIPDFLARMQAAKFIPHTDQSRFPSVKI